MVHDYKFIFHYFNSLSKVVLHFLRNTSQLCWQWLLPMSTRLLTLNWCRKPTRPPRKSSPHLYLMVEKKFSLDHMTIIFIVVELRELTLYLHQSGIVDLHWHTDYRAYRVNSGLRLMLTILYKCELLCEPLKIPLQISVDTIIFFHKKPLIYMNIYK